MARGATAKQKIMNKITLPGMKPQTAQPSAPMEGPSFGATASLSDRMKKLKERGRYA
jgi:hypothetical protein